MLESVDWAHASAEDGFGEQQMPTSRFVLTHLDPLAMLLAEDSEPSAAELPASPQLLCCRRECQCRVLPVYRGAFRLRVRETAAAQCAWGVRCHSPKQPWLSTPATPGLLQGTARPAAWPPSSHTSFQPRGHGHGAGRWS